MIYNIYIYYTYIYLSYDEPGQAASCESPRRPGHEILHQFFQGTGQGWKIQRPNGGFHTENYGKTMGKSTLTGNSSRNEEFSS